MANNPEYKTARWQRLRKWQLSKEPLCKFCANKGRLNAATVCDHVIPHKGDMALFWSGPFQSLCQNCHSASKQSIERNGFARDIGVDGWPVDQKHPSNRVQKWD